MAISFTAAPYVKAAESGITQIGCINCPPDIDPNAPVFDSDVSGIAVDASGNIYITEPSHKYVQKINSDGEFVTGWGGNGPYATGSGDGEFNYPLGVATDSTHVYVADSSNNRIQKFDTSGNYVSQIGSYGSADGELYGPYGVTADAGHIYTVDVSNNRITKFDSSGNYVTKFGTAGSGDGELSFANGIFARAGFVYVADTNNNRIQKFDASGNYVSQFGSFGQGAGEFHNPVSVYVDAAENIYVTDRYNHRIQKFNSAGTYVTQWGGSASSYGSEIGQFLNPEGITGDVAGNIYVADSSNRRIQVFTNNGVFIKIIGVDGDDEFLGGSQPGDGDGVFAFPAGVHVSAVGDIYVADNGNSRIQRFTGNGEFVAQWGGAGGPYGAGDGELAYPYSVTTAPNGDIYVPDYGNDRIQIFSSTGTYISQFGSYGSGDGELAEPVAVAVDDENNVYVSDYGNQRIQKFDSNGTFLAKSGTVGSGGEAGPFYLELDSAGNIWIATYEGLQKYSNNLELLETVELGVNGISGDWFTIGVAIGPGDQLYLNQFGSSGGRIIKISQQGALLSSWTPSRPGTFMPYGLSIDPTAPGRLIASSTQQNFIYILCDHDVSTSNCASPSGGGGDSGQALTYPDPVAGTTVTLILPNDVTNATVSAVAASSLPKDGDNQFPAGLTTFQFDTDPGATKTVSLYYDLPGNPNDYTARKYKTNSQTFIDVPGATITREDYNGKSMLKLTYNITDGGILDQDGQANGTVIDPVGLASNNLASTGENVYTYLAGIVSLVGVGMWVSRKAFK